jgi:hypothetical protein
MALAILKYIGKSGGHHEFEADIGTSTYYQYKTGKVKRKEKGLELVDEVLHQSAVIKAPVLEHNGFNTRFRFRIPEDMITRDNRFIQLSSYKAPSQLSPSVSEVVTLLPVINDLNGDYKLPKMMTLTHTNGHATKDISKIPCERAPLQIKDSTVSEAMFFNAILGALPNLLTNALPMISKIIPGLQKALPIAEKVLPELGKIIPTDVKPGKEGLDQILQSISPDTIKAIMEVVQSVNAKNDNSATQGKSETKSFSKYSNDFSINPSTLMQLAPLLEKVLSPESIKAIGDNPVQLFKAISDSAVKFQTMDLDKIVKTIPAFPGSNLDKTVQSMALRRRDRIRYSEAKIAPALLAALPALMPLLEKVANPEMIKAIGEQPVKMFNAVADAGLKNQKMELDHLERINPGVDDKGFDMIVASMSVKSSVAIKAKFSDAFAIEFADVKTIPVGGKDKVVYDRRQKMHIPFKVSSSAKAGADNVIPRAIAQVIIQDGDSMNVVLEKKFKLKDVTVGTNITGVSLESEDLKKLPLNRDLKVELSLNWKKAGKVEGTFKNHYIWVSDGYLYQRSGKNIKQHFALNDVTRFRNYWHKVWEGGPETHERWKIDFECKYYYALNNKDTSIKKLETKKKIVSDSGSEGDGESYRRKIAAKLKSGMEVSLAAYNELLSLHQLTPLNSAQLTAFLGQDFAKESSAAARVSVDFKGRKGDTATLWTYPEGNIQSYVLGKTTTVDPSGMVTATQEEEVYFPKFSTIHFIGTKSE